MKRSEIVRAGILTVALIASIYEVIYGPARAVNTLAALTLAATLFSIRKHYRVTYGVIEIAFGIFALAYTWRAGRGAFSSDFSSDFDIFVWQLVVLSTLTGVYVIIRGLDNIDQGSQPGKGRHPYVLRMHAMCQRIIAAL